MMPEDFMRKTPEEFKLICDGWKIREERADRRIARLCSIIANVNRNPKKRPQAFSEEDFIPRPKQRKKQTNEEMLQMVVAMNRAFGGKGGD